LRVIGIETSCDETAASVVEEGHVLLSNVVASSMDLHVQYGGVVPEIAARSHIEAIIPVIEQALSDATCTWDDIDAIAVTYGAGLGGSLLIGVLTARTLAIAKNKPLYAINHVEGHLYANFLTSTPLPGYVLPEAAPEFPVLGLIVSGGHSQLVYFRSHFDYTLLGQEQIGEDFTFPSTGLAARLTEEQKADIAASFVRVANETVVDKTVLAFEEFQPKTVIVGGGVASSPPLRKQLAERLPFPPQYTDRKLCTDNGAMIATLGCYKAMLGQPTADPYTLDIAPNLSM
jgi:N6-L-threonylcarbamoyladenine synthase